MTKTKVKRIALCVLGSIVALAAIYCLLRFGFSIDVFDRSGWNHKNGAYRYLDYYGRPQTRWQEIDGKRYYFAPEDGTMVTGWHTIDGAQFYFHTDGVRAAGWLQIDGTDYYLGENGVMATGWQQIDGKTYYFAQDGAMTVGWLQLDGSRMYFSEEGVLQTGWLTLEGKQYEDRGRFSVFEGTTELPLCLPVLQKGCAYMYISIEDFLRKIPGGVQVNGNETAVPVHMVSQILDIVSKNQWIILGGDVLTAQGEYVLANWHYNPNEACSLEENVNKSIQKSREFISDYVKRNGSDWLIVFVISNSYVAGG